MSSPRPRDPRLAPPPGLAARLAGQLRTLLHARVAQLLAGVRYVRRLDTGVITAVDTAAGTARFEAGVAAYDVTYSRGAPPQVGDYQFAYVPNAGVPWIKTAPPGGWIRWLYYRQLEDPTWALYRVRWPLADTSVPQRVATVPAPNWRRFFGFHVPSRTVLEARPLWLQHGTSGAASTDEQTLVLQYPDWGFGAPVVVPTEHFTGWLGSAPDKEQAAPTELWLASWEPIAADITWGIDNSVAARIDAQMCLLASRDGGGTWSALTTVEYSRPIPNPAWGFNANPAFYPLIHGLAAVQGLPGPTLAYPVLTLTDPPVSTDDPAPPLYTAAVALYDRDGYRVTGISTPRPSLAVFGTAQGTRPEGLGQRDAGSLAYYVPLDTAAPVNPGFGWTAPTSLERGDGTATGVTWTALPAANLAALSVAADGQALIGFPQRGAGRILSDDWGATWVAAPPPWRGGDDDPFITDDLVFVDIPAADALATEAPA